MEDGDVIVIAPPAKNKDGTQTFYILDPCPSSEDTDEVPGLELMDMTAEVKNTGAIAVVSTNSNTGALEITLAKKTDTLMEDMDTHKNCITENLNQSLIDADKDHLAEAGSENNLSLEHDANTTRDNIENNQVNHSLIETNAIRLKSEPDSLDQQAEDQYQQIDTEQDDDVEEGTLYIDDNKNCEFQDELNVENSEDHKEIDNIEKEESKQNESEVVLDDTTANNDSSVKYITNVPNNIIELIPPKKVNDVSDDDHNLQRYETEQIDTNVTAVTCEAYVHGHLIKIPSSVNRTSVSDSIKESVDSTNLALTLLELAGGPSYRSSVEQELIEREQLQVERQGTPPSSDSQLSVTVESQPAPDLITLQPVPIDHSIEDQPVPMDDLTEDQPVPVDHLTEEPPITTDQSIKNNAFCNDDSVSSVTVQDNQSNISTPTRKVRISTELVQRLLESEESSSRPQYKHLSRPSVTKSEIAQEIYERSRQKYPYTEETSKDVFFAMKIAHRLASKIVPTEKSIDIPDKTINEIQSHNAQSILSQNDKILKCKEENKCLSNKKDTISDNIELLKILEDDPDDIPVLDSIQIPIVIDKKPKIKITRPRAPLLKLHPEIEKELALKQLQDFGSGKKKVEFVPEVRNKVDVHSRGRTRKNNENNNNSQKRGVNDSPLRAHKKTKNGAVDGSVTVHPSQITETLTVEGQDFVEEQSKDGKSLKQYSNKRLSRSSETPPRDMPMEILLNGIEDDLEGAGDKLTTSKNKIFKATNTRKRQEELKKKHFANMLQRNKPQKKRGRPPKKKPVPTDDMLNREFLMNIINEQSKTTDTPVKKDSKNIGIENKTSKTEKPLKTRTMREIERLLGDEGAINMLYSVEQKRQTGSEPKRGVLPSYRRKKKDLMLKTKLVKSAVLRLSASPSQPTGRVSLRGQGSKDVEEQHNEEVALRKMSVDSHDSHQYVSSPPSETFSFPAKIVPAEASRIIRRHSSSSNYSSRSNSPRRLSLDGERFSMGSPEALVETGCQDAPPHTAGLFKNGKNLSLQETNKGSISKTAGSSDSSNKEIFQHPKTSIEIQKVLGKTPPNSKPKASVAFDQSQGRKPGRPRKNASLEDEKKSLDLNTSLAAALDDFTKEFKKDKHIPAKPRLVGKDSPLPKVAVYSKSPGTSSRKKVRGAVLYNELALHRHKNLVEITVDPASSKIKNALNIDVMRELIAVLAGLVKDDNCRVVLLNSAGSVFCQGVDFPALVQPTAEQRMTAAQDMALAIKELVKMMATFPKPIVAAVQGAAVGLGTTLLPLCDLVLASEQATFHTPYARLGQVPEGAATLTLPSLLGYAAASELLFVGRKLSAAEAHQLGLVTRIIPDDTLQTESMSVATTIASQSTQAMSATKALLRHTLMTGLETTLVSETHLLTQHWTSTECQENFTQYIHGQGDLAFIFTKQST